MGAVEGVTAVRTVLGTAAVSTLDPSGPVVRLYGRQHIDLQRVAAALCCH